MFKVINKSIGYPLLLGHGVYIYIYFFIYIFFFLFLYFYFFFFLYFYIFIFLSFCFFVYLFFCVFVCVFVFVFFFVVWCLGFRLFQWGSDVSPEGHAAADRRQAQLRA